MTRWRHDVDVEQAWDLWLVMFGIQVVQGAETMIFERGVCATTGGALQDMLIAVPMDRIVFEYLGDDKGGSLDYPDQVPPIVNAVLARPGTLGVLICGSGQAWP